MEIINLSVVDKNLEIIIKSDNSMYVVRKINLASNVNRDYYYNRYWYNDFIQGKYEKQPKLYRGSYTTSYNIPFSRSFSIYGDQYTEKITLRVSYNWPYDVYQPADFNTVLEIKEKSTTINYMNGGSRTTSDCSLQAVGGKAHFAADAGEYFESMKQQFIAKQIGRTKVIFGIWLGIPKTPFGLTTVYEQSGISASTLGEQSFRSQNAQGNNKCKNASAYFDPYSIHMTTPGHYLKATARVQNDSPSNLTGNKYLKIRWDYTIISSGNNNGTSVPTFSHSGNYTNTLYYCEH